MKLRGCAPSSPSKGGPPSHDTFTRVFALLDTHAFEGAVRHWMRQLIPVTPAPDGSGPATPPLRQVACDGKKLRGSRRGQPGTLQMAATVNLWSIKEGLCLAWRRIPEASGEGPQCELLLRHLQLKGVILSGDAAYFYFGKLGSNTLIINTLVFWADFSQSIHNHQVIG